MHYISLINGMSNAQADDLMSFATDLLDGSSGIVASTDYAVAQSSPVAMSVTVGTGKAYIYISSLASYYRTLLDAAVTLSIAANSSGSTRIDTICIKVDTGATPDADASNVATVVVVQGTPGAGAPATPANHYKLAEVTVANGAVSIVTANIADSRVQLNIRTGTKVGGVTPGAATDAAITFTDVTTNNASTTKHGFLKKLSNVATEFMNGVGNWVAISVASDGWVDAAESWAYASATTITVPSGAASKYAKGDKIKLTQTTVKYFYIVGVADTVLTVTGGSDYTVANAAISANYYSHQTSPVGFPMEMNCAALTWNTSDIDNGTGGQQPTAGSHKFCIIGNKLFLRGAWANSNVFKNGAGATISTSALPATLPANTSFFNLPCGIANPGGVNATITDRAAGEFRLNANSSIADNTNLTYSGFIFEYFF